MDLARLRTLLANVHQYPLDRTKHRAHSHFLRTLARASRIWVQRDSADERIHLIDAEELEALLHNVESDIDVSYRSLAVTHEHEFEIVVRAPNEWCRAQLRAPNVAPRVEGRELEK